MFWLKAGGRTGGRERRGDFFLFFSLSLYLHVEASGATRIGGNKKVPLLPSWLNNKYSLKHKEHSVLLREEGPLLIKRCYWFVWESNQRDRILTRDRSFVRIFQPCNSHSCVIIALLLKKKYEQRDGQRRCFETQSQKGYSHFVFVYNTKTCQNIYLS